MYKIKAAYNQKIFHYKNNLIHFQISKMKNYKYHQKLGEVLALLIISKLIIKLKTKIYQPKICQSKSQGVMRKLRMINNNRLMIKCKMRKIQIFHWTYLITFKALIKTKKIIVIMKIINKNQMIMIPLFMINYKTILINNSKPNKKKQKIPHFIHLNILINS